MTTRPPPSKAELVDAAADLSRRLHDLAYEAYCYLYARGESAHAATVIVSHGYATTSLRTIRKALTNAR